MFDPEKRIGTRWTAKNHAIPESAATARRRHAPITRRFPRPLRPPGLWIETLYRCRTSGWRNANRVLGLNPHAHGRNPAGYASKPRAMRSLRSPNRFMMCVFRFIDGVLIRRTCNSLKPFASCAMARGLNTKSSPGTQEKNEPSSMIFNPHSADSDRAGSHRTKIESEYQDPEERTRLDTRSDPNITHSEANVPMAMPTTSGLHCHIGQQLTRRK